MNEKIMDIIKKKVDEATMEELDEALIYVEAQIKRLRLSEDSRHG